MAGDFTKFLRMRGDSWVSTDFVQSLESASPEQTETFKAQTAADVAATKVWLDETAKE